MATKAGLAFAIVVAAPIFAALAREKHLAGLAPPAFSARAAHYLGELNALHPFQVALEHVAQHLNAPDRRHIGETNKPAVGSTRAEHQCTEICVDGHENALLLRGELQERRRSRAWRRSRSAGVCGPGYRAVAPVDASTDRKE
jgi:hypothetical protein